MVVEKKKSEVQFISKNVNIDRENGIIKNVCIIQEGICKNGDYVSPEFLNDLVDMGNEQKQGVKSRFGHPNMCDTTLGSFIGRFKNYTVVHEDGMYKVLADLNLAEITKKTDVKGQGVSMWEYLLDMAEENPDMFGTSIHFSATQEEYVDDKGETPTTDWGSPVMKPTLKSYFASDVVDSPAATTDLFKGSADFGVKATAFLDDNPQIFEIVKNEPSILEGFIKKYANYIKSNDMSFLDKMRKSLSGTKDVDVTLADGSIVTVVTENETPQVGDSVVDADGGAVGDDNHVDADGNTIVTESGVITDIIPAEEDGGDDGDDGDEPVEDEMSVEALKTANENREVLEHLVETMTEMKSTLALIQKSVKSKGFEKPQVTRNKNIDNNPSEGGNSFYDRLEAARAKKEES